MAVLAVEREGGAARLEARPTHWGYSLRQTGGAAETGSLREGLGRFGGLVLVLAAYGQWLFPASMTGLDHSVLAFLLGALGAMIYWRALRGFASDLQVDLGRRELRLVRRNSRGETRCERSVPMERVHSVFLVRCKDPAIPAELFLRLRSGENLRIGRGDEAELETIRLRLRDDLRSPRVRLAERFARVRPVLPRRPAHGV